MMPLARRDDDDSDNCGYSSIDGEWVCYDNDSWWHGDKGYVAKWIIFGVIFLIFATWFIGGYIHAKKRLRKGQPLLGYHRWLVSYGTRRKYGQPPQNHFTFYNQQRPYGQQQSQQPYVQRADGTYPEPPPLYNGDAPPSYYAPPVPKTNPEQSAGQYGMLPPQYGAAPQASGPSQYGAPAGYQEVPLGNYPTSAQQSGVAYPAPPQQSGVVAGSSSNDVEAQNHNQAQNPELPPRPQQAKLAISSFMSRFRK